METLASFRASLRKPAIYSAQAVLGFSTLVNPLVGGLLAFYSLRRAGQLSPAWSALCASVNFWAFTLLVSSNLKWGSVFRAGLGYMWGRWLNRYISRKLPDAGGYPCESILLPVLLCLFFGIMLLLITQLIRHY